MKGGDLKEVRKKHNLTQKDLADLLGLSVETIKKYEADRLEIKPLVQLLLEQNDNGELYVIEIRRRLTTLFG